MNQKITLFVKWQVKEGQLEAVLNNLGELIAKSRAESGNLSYHIHQSRSDAQTLLLYEVYADEAALEAHRASEHFKQIVLARIVPLLQEREAILATEL